MQRIISNSGTRRGKKNCEGVWEEIQQIKMGVQKVGKPE